MCPRAGSQGPDGDSGYLWVQDTQRVLTPGEVMSASTQCGSPVTGYRAPRGGDQAIPVGGGRHSAGFESPQNLKSAIRRGDSLTWEVGA